MDSFPDLEPICCSMFSSNCCFLTCIQISQEAGQVVWYSHLLKNFPEFVVVHTVKGFGIVNKAATAAAPKSLQSCPTLCDSMDRSLPGSSIHGICQARVLEWVAIAFSAIKQKYLFFWNSLAFSMIQWMLAI